jgi:hypothetical protein
MNRQSNEKSIELKLLQLVDAVVLGPEQKEHAVRQVKQLLHASRVANVKGLKKAIDRFLETVLRDGALDQHNDD